MPGQLATIEVEVEEEEKKEQKQAPESQPENHYDVVISGMGPVALVAAWEAIKIGKRVLMISDRSADFVRVQRVRLNEGNVLHLKAMSPKNPTDDDDKKFLQELDSSIFIALKDIERYVMRRLMEFKESGKPIFFVFQTKLTHVDLQNGQARFGSEEKRDLQAITFTHLVGADGVNHHALNVVQEHKDISQRISYKKADDIKYSYPHHMGAYLSITRADGRDLVLPPRDHICSLQQDNLLYWLMMQRHSFRKSLGKRIKCGFLSELPQGMFDIADEKKREEKALDYARSTILDYFAEAKLDNGVLNIEKVKDSKKHGPAKDKLKLTLFKADIVEASQAAMESKGHYFFLVGDAFCSPSYQVSLGLNDGMSAARMVAAVIGRNMSLDTYNEKCKRAVQHAVGTVNTLFAEKKSSATCAQEVLDEIEKKFRR